MTVNFPEHQINLNFKLIMSISYDDLYVRLADTVYYQN